MTLNAQKMIKIYFDFSFSASDGQNETVVGFPMTRRSDKKIVLQPKEGSTAALLSRIQGQKFELNSLTPTLSE